MFPLVLAVLLAAAAIVYVLRPLFGGGAAVAVEAPASPRDALEREKEGIYLAIRELEFDHGTGVVSDEDYSRLIARYRAHAVSLLKAIDQLDKEAGPTGPLAGALRPEPAAAACPACGTPNDAGHGFCTRCGGEIAAPGHQGDAPSPGKAGG